MVASLIATAGCGFEGSGSAFTPTGDAATETPDTPEVPVTCGMLVCDPHAVCNDGAPASCSCGPGYEGDGFSCHDVDECALADTDCNSDEEDATLCQNTTGGHTCYILDSCAEAKAHGVPDGETPLYVGEDPNKPWRAYCDNGATYLTLARTGANDNFAQYTKAPDRPLESNVKTRYTKLRIDPATLVVDIADRTYATSSGMLLHNLTVVTSMPYGIAMDCSDNEVANGLADIDLRGLPFKVTSTFAGRGVDAAGTATFSNADQVVALTGGGKCGWYGPTPVPFNPFNDFEDNSKILQLAYRAD